MGHLWFWFGPFDFVWSVFTKQERDPLLFMCEQVTGPAIKLLLFILTASKSGEKPHQVNIKSHMWRLKWRVDLWYLFDICFSLASLILHLPGNLNPRWPSMKSDDWQKLKSLVIHNSPSLLCKLRSLSCLHVFIFSCFCDILSFLSSFW